MVCSLILLAADSLQEKLSKAAVFVHENKNQINTKFAELLMNVWKKMVKNEVDVNKFLFFVKVRFPRSDGIPQSPTDLNEIFQAITRYGLWDSFNYSLLVTIVQIFGAGDPDMKVYIQNYRRDLQAYSIVAGIVDDIESDLETCTDRSRVDSAKCDPHYNCPVEGKMDLVKHSLQYFTDVWEMFCTHYPGLPDSPPAALCDRVRKAVLQSHCVQHKFPHK